MLHYHREYNPNKVLSSDWYHLFNPLAYCWNPFSGFSRAPGDFKPYLLDFNFDSDHLGEFPWCALATVRSIYGTEHLKSMFSIYRTCEQCSRGCILWYISSVINERKAHMIAPLLNSRHTSVGPHWVYVWGNNIFWHWHSESILPLGLAVEAP